MHQLVVRGGTVVDGSGLLRRRADIAVDAGRISRIGGAVGAGECEIDATGLVVAPGIVDVHTHYDPQLTFEPLASSSCFHGVTTVVTGNCGFSVAPLRPGDSEWLIQMFARVEGMDPAALGGIPFAAFESFPEFLGLLDGNVGINAACYVGHSAVRRYVLGDDAQERPATRHEVAAMAEIVGAAVAAGAIGLSSSHAATHLDLAGRPVPSRLATVDELLALVGAAAANGATSVGYLPGSVVTGGLDTQDEDLILQMAAFGPPVIIQGLGARSKVDAPTEGWEAAMAFTARADALGVAVYSMTMSKPYNRSFSLGTGTTLYEGVPAFHRLFQEIGVDDRTAVAGDEAFRAAARAGMAAPNDDPRVGPVLQPPGWDRLFVEQSSSFPEREGRAIVDLASDLGTHPLDVMLDTAIADRLATTFVWRTESPAWIEGMRLAQRDPHMLVGTSDGGAHLDRDDGAEASSYFLAKWVREWGAFSLEEGIRQLTAIPAALCGFRDRGLLLPGFAADMMIFDPAVIGPGTKSFAHDFPGGAGRWTSRPVGVAWTIVNGVPLIHDGVVVDPLARPGVLLRSGARTGSPRTEGTDK